MSLSSFLHVRGSDTSPELSREDHATDEARRRSKRWWRRARRTLLLLILLGACWLGDSLGRALTNPALGTTLGARLAEWGRAHDAGSFVNWAENEWYSHHPPPVGGAPPPGAIKVPVTTTVSTHTTVPHLRKPPPLTPFATPALPGEGEWSAAGRLVDGLPALYVTTLRPDAVHTSYVVGVAWMDTKLLRATLYPGSWIPGGGPYTDMAPIGPPAARSLVAAFNSGFLMADANGGYYTEGRTIDPLRKGAASYVIYRNGRSTVGAWDEGVSMTSQVVSVRQNLDLLVNNSRPVPGLSTDDNFEWGGTLGNQDYVWRSGLGVTKSGALVYVGGPGLDITDLAAILARAGCVRAMELDINTSWVNFTWYRPSSPHGLANGDNGTELLASMAGGPSRYFQSWWARDFITMSAIAADHD